eukprot:m.11141 g.11141  ORF g.11141 m.11141 type:complete len:83 (+) comp6822_c0_seq1:612-860(+)
MPLMVWLYVATDNFCHVSEDFPQSLWIIHPNKARDNNKELSVCNFEGIPENKIRKKKSEKAGENNGIERNELEELEKEEDES